MAGQCSVLYTYKYEVAIICQTMGGFRNFSVITYARQGH
jgi:hypothetical protein